MEAILKKKNSQDNFVIGYPGGMYTETVSLYESELRVSEALLDSNISLIEKFRVYKKQYSPRLGVSIAIFTFVFMLLFLATVIFLEINRNKDTA